MHKTDLQPEYPGACDRPVENRRQYRSAAEADDRPQAECSQPMPTRLTSREAIYHKVEQLRRQANQLEALARAIPQDITHEADVALHELLCCIR